MIHTAQLHTAKPCRIEMIVMQSRVYTVNWFFTLDQDPGDDSPLLATSHLVTFHAIEPGKLRTCNRPVTPLAHFTHRHDECASTFVNQQHHKPPHCKATVKRSVVTAQRCYRNRTPCYRLRNAPRDNRRVNTDKGYHRPRQRHEAQMQPHGMKLRRERSV